MGRLIPHRLNLADPTGDQDKVEWAIAHHLVSDVDVGATRVASRGAQAVSKTIRQLARFGCVLAAALGLSPSRCELSSSPASPGLAGLEESPSDGKGWFAWQARCTYRRRRCRLDR